MDLVSRLYYSKIGNFIMLVVISFSAAATVKCLFCVSTVNCCYMGPWHYVSNTFTGNSEMIIEWGDFKTSLEMVCRLYNVVDKGSAKSDVRSERYVMNWLSCVYYVEVWSLVWIWFT